MKILAIAVNTFKEAVRNRVLYVLLFFSVVIMLGAWVASTLSIDEETKIVRDLGIGAINIISVLIAVFVGIGLVYNDLDKKTIYTIVSKPISRWQFILGKYLGLMLTISVNVLFMTWIFASVLYFRSYLATDVMFKAFNYTDASGTLVPRGGGFMLWYYFASIVQALALGAWHLISLGNDGATFTAGLLTASLFTILEMAVITAFAILFSSFSSPTLSAFLTVIVFIIGRLNQDLYLFADTMATRAGGLDNLSGGQVLVYFFSKGSAYLTPNLAIFDKRREISQFLPVSFQPLDIAYAAVYTTLVLVIAVMIFNRRNFK
jgi:ABC-type transport system involved in multi-copper enzyme maturation permease subunit